VSAGLCGRTRSIPADVYTHDGDTADCWNSYAMNPLPVFASRCHAKYSHKSPFVALVVCIQMFLRSVWPLGLVKSSIGGTAVWMTPTLVPDPFFGPSSWTLPKGSAVCVGPGATPLAGTTPSMVKGFCADASVVMSA